VKKMGRKKKLQLVRGSVRPPRPTEGTTLEIKALECLEIIIEKGRDNPELYGRVAVDACKVVLIGLKLGQKEALPPSTAEETARRLEEDQNPGPGPAS
jgi:hypothetical protein